MLLGNQNRTNFHKGFSKTIHFSTAAICVFVPKCIIQNTFSGQAAFFSFSRSLGIIFFFHRLVCRLLLVVCLSHRLSVRCFISTVFFSLSNFATFSEQWHCVRDIAILRFGSTVFFCINFFTFVAAVNIIVMILFYLTLRCAIPLSIAMRTSMDSALQHNSKKEKNVQNLVPCTERENEHRHRRNAISVQELVFCSF